MRGGDLLDPARSAATMVPAQSLPQQSTNECKTPFAGYQQSIRIDSTGFLSEFTRTRRSTRFPIGQYHVIDKSLHCLHVAFEPRDSPCAIQSAELQLFRL